MAVKITYGSPNKWRRWLTSGTTFVFNGVAHDRPDPSSWFFEARYHHTGTWKIGLDFRPQDGKMPDLWHPPFMWRPAWEIMEVQTLLSMNGTIGVAELMELGFNEVSSLSAALQEYGEKAKKSKKLLFGSAEGSGAHSHGIKVLDTLAEGPVGGVLSGAQLLQKHGPSTIPVLGEGGPEFILPAKWKVQGNPLPYDPVLWDQKLGLWDTKFELVGMIATVAKAGWDCTFRFGIRMHGVWHYQEFDHHVSFWELNGASKGPNDCPIFLLPSMTILEMNPQSHLKLDVTVQIKSAGGFEHTLVLNTHSHPSMFPTQGLMNITHGGYVVFNQKPAAPPQIFGMDVIVHNSMGDDQLSALNKEQMMEIIKGMGVSPNMLKGKDKL